MYTRIATRLMINHIQIKDKGTELLLVWNRPKYTPYKYKYHIQCRYMAVDTSYLSKDVVKSFGSTISRVENVHFGSFCKIHFFAIYNPMSLDKGLHIGHITQIRSK